MKTYYPEFIFLKKGNLHVAANQDLLVGSLRPDIAQESMVEYLQEGPLPLMDLLKRLPVQAERVQLVMVNHKAVPFDYAVCPGDRVALFPKEYMIFADWKNFRS